MLNPILEEVRLLIAEHPQGIDEYGILTALKQHPALANLGEGHLPLFQKHFLIMNALYQVQADYWDEKKAVLEITPLINKLHAQSPSAQETQLIRAESQGPSEYYLNWENFNKTTEQDVLNLYKSFWEFLAKDEKREVALSTLELPADASTEEIKRQYKKLAMQHHPDKGGNSTHFIEIQAAYEVLKPKFSEQT